MKIQITQTVNVDPEEWALEFQIQKNEVRKHVKDHFNGLLQQVIDELELGRQEKAREIETK